VRAGTNMNLGISWYHNPIHSVLKQNAKCNEMHYSHIPSLSASHKYSSKMPQMEGTYEVGFEITSNLSESG
jgi:hypothetical protein